MIFLFSRLWDWYDLNIIGRWMIHLRFGVLTHGWDLEKFDCLPQIFGLRADATWTEQALEGISEGTLLSWGALDSFDLKIKFAIWVAAVVWLGFWLDLLWALILYRVKV